MVLGLILTGLRSSSNDLTCLCRCQRRVSVVVWCLGHVTTAESAADESPVHDWRLHDPVRQRAAAVRLAVTAWQHPPTGVHATVVSHTWHSKHFTLQGGRGRAVTRTDCCQSRWTEFSVIPRAG